VGKQFRNPTMTFPDRTSRQSHAGSSSRQRIVTRVLVALSIVCAIAAVLMGLLGIQALLEW
jgi:type VI protein secretion system component VasF